MAKPNLRLRLRLRQATRQCSLCTACDLQAVKGSVLQGCMCLSDKSGLAYCF